MINFPKIHYVNQLPNGIRSSDRAAYMPSTNTIWIRKLHFRGLYYPFGIIFFYKDTFHELGHWLGFRLNGKESKLHRWLDGGEPNFH